MWSRMLFMVWDHRVSCPQNPYHQRVLIYCAPWVIYLHTMRWKHTIIQWRLWVHGLMGGNENPTSITGNFENATSIRPWMGCSDQPYMGLLWPPTMQLAWLQNYISLNYKTGNSDCWGRQSYFSGRNLIIIAVLCTTSVHGRRKRTAINRTVLVTAFNQAEA